jgi:hypothetical protein
LTAAAHENPDAIAGLEGAFETVSEFIVVEPKQKSRFFAEFTKKGASR